LRELKGLHSFQGVAEMPKDATQNVQNEFESLIMDAYRVSIELGEEVEAVLQEGRDRPLSREEAVRVLSRVITTIRQGATRRGDAATGEALSGDIDVLVQRLVDTRERLRPSDRSAKLRDIQLVPRNGIPPGPVQPRPCFHGRDVPMTGGFIKTADINLWKDNERLDIHLAQFREQNGREPSPPEVLDIMLSRVVLPGVTEADQFEVVALARSIAVNGVRKPPILAYDGTLLDGNRRLAACHYILSSSSDEFDTEAKRRAEYIYVWQLTEHATDDERDAVVVSLNFESDCKLDWPEYIKARKVHEEWQGMLALEPRLPTVRRQAEMKRNLSKKFALGPDTGVVNRYLKMVEWATEFESYHINEKRRDTFEVQHRANRYFQYFDELAKGASPGGVAHALQQDEAFKHLVFDLLFEGKFRNWRQIRELKFINDNEEARESLVRARNEHDVEVAEDHLENAMTIARTRRAENREVGANTRIESFVKWLEDLPISAVRDRVRPDNLLRLQSALRLVNGYVQGVLEVDQRAETA